MSAGSPSGGVYFVERGPADAPVVVLVHGSMDRSSGMARVVRRLADDFRVVVYDRRGYGRSRHAAGPRTIDRHVDDLLGLLAGPATVFGHSLGGDIALAAAERRPDLVAAVGAYEPPMPWEPWWPDNTAGGDALRKGDGAAASPEAAAEAFMRRMIGDRLWDGLPSATREERRAEGVTLVEELADLRRARPYAPEQIQVPVLVARGEHARPQHRQGTTRLAAQFASAGRSAPLEVVEVPGVGHGIHLEDPAAMAGLVRRLVAVSRS